MKYLNNPKAPTFNQTHVVNKSSSVLDVTAIVLANLCVCYIMTSLNDRAESLMKSIEKEVRKQATTHVTHCRKDETF